MCRRSHDWRRAADTFPSPELREAERASHDGRFGDARPLLEAIVESPSARPEHREAAAQELARIAWRIDGKPDAARVSLEKIARDARKKVPPLLLLSRMERTLRRFEAARAAARRALAAAGTDVERRSATIALSSALVEDVKDGATREYRAKLSEIAFAPAPRLAFAGILTDGIGNPTPHGSTSSRTISSAQPPARSIRWRRQPAPTDSRAAARISRHLPGSSADGP